MDTSKNTQDARKIKALSGMKNIPTIAIFSPCLNSLKGKQNLLCLMAYIRFLCPCIYLPMFCIVPMYYCIGLLISN